ncbi:hypothetical protein BGX23_008683 [Mortierella sp. AD031]|nr:hypothetical protein BGX23_008683 [Mortierella sp. AD031]KAG0204075.1 hypothetical protein BGX33_008713 [Mortierella sp. NVP41]
MSHILCVCAHNAVHSQIAAALFTKHKTQPGIKVISAGLTPAPEISAFVLETMSEIGLDLPIKISPEITKNVGTIVTLGCGNEIGPYVPEGVKTVDWVITFHKTSPKEDARALRNGNEAKVKEFIIVNGY